MSSLSHSNLGKGSSAQQLRSSSSISNDKFLKAKQIEPQRSQFLSEHFSMSNKRSYYDPKDKYGVRLNPALWSQPTDTIFSVCLKRMKDNFLAALNPDTFSKKTLIQLNQQLTKNKLNVIGFILILTIPFSMAHPFIRPRMQAIRRDMLFQYYKQTGILSRQLKTPMRKLSKEEMQQVINKATQKVNL